MKLRQLTYIVEIVRNDLNVSQTAQNLFTSQPGVSKQVRLLEDELGVQIFSRSGKHFVDVTPAGKKIISMAQEMLLIEREIKRVASEYSDESKGSLSIGVTHTQARYVLPTIIKQFANEFPEVTIDMHQGSPQQIAQMVSEGKLDFAAATEGVDQFSNLIKLPVYQWNRAIIVPKKHPLANISYITLADIAKYPIVTYVFGFTGRSQLDRAFEAEELQPRVVCTAADADVIKTYVRMDLGVGIVAKMAIDSRDTDLALIDASHLFESSTTQLCFKKGMFLRNYMYRFIELFAPHLSRDIVDQAAVLSNPDDIKELISKIEVPYH